MSKRLSNRADKPAAVLHTQKPRAKKLRCKGWRQECLLRMLENVQLVGENPSQYIVYASLGKSARNKQAFDAIRAALLSMEEDETLLVQSGKPIGLIKTHADAPLVIAANCNVVGHYATPEVFYDLQAKGLICWGGLTAGAWQYIGSQGVIQGTYEIFLQIARQHFAGLYSESLPESFHGSVDGQTSGASSEREHSPSLAGKFVLTAGLGGMGCAQPLAGVMAGAAILVVEAQKEVIEKRIASGFLQHRAASLDAALARIARAVRAKEAVSVGLHGNAADIFPEIARRGITPDVVTDQTAAHDLVFGYIPPGLTPARLRFLRQHDRKDLAAQSRRAVARHVRAMLTFQKRGAVVFDNGNLIRTQARDAGVQNAFDIPIFTEAFLRPLFCSGIGPFRWIALSGNPQDIARIDDLALALFADNASITNWIPLARSRVPFQGYPARIGWLGHAERTTLALHVNDMVKSGIVSAPVAFTRDHLDAGAMTNPHIMTERMKDGSDAVSDWPLLNAMMHCASRADLVAVHSGGGGYSGYMTSAGVTVIADGTAAAARRISSSIHNDTSLGIMRYADAGYGRALAEAKSHGIRYVGEAYHE